MLDEQSIKELIRESVMDVIISLYLPAVHDVRVIDACMTRINNKIDWSNLAFDSVTESNARTDTIEIPIATGAGRHRG